MTLVVYLLTCVAHTAVVLALLLAAIFWYFRPFRVSSHLPGPQRHWLFGTTFGDSDVFLAVENNSNKKKTEVETTFDWEQWPTLSLAISRHLDFRIWGGTTLNIGFGGAFFNVVSPAELQYILSTNMSNYVKGKLALSFDEIIGHTAFTTDGVAWRFHRKSTVVILNRDAVQYTATITNQKLRRVENHLRGKEGQVVDFQDNISDDNERTCSLNKPRRNSCRRYYTRISRFLIAACLIAVPGTFASSTTFLPQLQRRRLAISTIKPVVRTIETKVSRPESNAEAAWVSGIKNSLASALAAGCSKLILAPFDTIKTLQQHSRTAGSSPLSLIQAAQVIMKRPRGFIEFYAGIGVAVVGSMPSVGLYFGIYSFCKKTFQQWDPDHYDERQTFYIALSAAIGNTIASASRVPYEVIKQKFQMKVYASMGDAIRDLSWSTLFPTGGIASQMLRDIPYAVVTLLVYEHLKSVWKVRAQKVYPEVPVRAWDMLVGGLAGGIGSWVTNPMDVMKTRLQMDSGGGLYGGSIRSCAEQTWQEGGPSAFLRGSVPRLLHKVPANAFFFLFYEFFRSVLRVQDDAK